MNARCAIPLAVLSLALAAPSISAQAMPAAASKAKTRLELGRMWTFENPPLAYLEEEYGFAPNAQWLDALRMASLRFGSWCSASFVSPKGLIMTNHHCVRDKIADVSPPEEDWVKNGFYASAYEQEVELLGLTVQQLVSMRDVTDEINRGIADGDSPAAAKTKRDENEARVLADAKKNHEDLTAQVVKLHQGAAFHLYLYKVYDDIRLVCSPHLQTAHFGGDPDNFTYPRFSIDFAFCRAYEDDKPVDTSKHYFKWSKAGARDGEVVFVTGNPGSTERLLTHAQMESKRDAYYPLSVQMIGSRLRILRGFAKQIPGVAQQLRRYILGDENSFKALDGELRGLRDEGLMAEKKAFEADFRAAVQANPDLKKKFGGVWDELERIARAETELFPKAFFYTPSYSDSLTRAVAVVRATMPDATDEDKKVANELAGQPTRRSDPLREALFIDHLGRAKVHLGAEDPYVKAAIGDLDPMAALARLQSSECRKPEFMRALLDGGQEKVNASDDPALVIARVIVPTIIANEKQQADLDARKAVQERLIGQAMYACYGNKISPDATMTLRFTDGRVKGYPYNGTIAPYRTTFYGLYARNTEFDNEEPFLLPKIWLDRLDKIDMTKAVNFVSTNDIIGGNSGSPVVNKELEVVGLIFDGNIEQLSNNFLYRTKTERSVSVHVDAIIEAMKKIYEAQRVIDELHGK